MIMRSTLSPALCEVISLPTPCKRGRLRSLPAASREKSPLRESKKMVTLSTVPTKYLVKRNPRHEQSRAAPEGRYVSRRAASVFSETVRHGPPARQRLVELRAAAKLFELTLRRSAEAHDTCCDGGSTLGGVADVVARPQYRSRRR